MVLEVVAFLLVEFEMTLPAVTVAMFVLLVQIPTAHAVVVVTEVVAAIVAAVVLLPVPMPVTTAVSSTVDSMKVAACMVEMAVASHMVVAV